MCVYIYIVHHITLPLMIEQNTQKHFSSVKREMKNTFTTTTNKEIDEPN